MIRALRSKAVDQRLIHTGQHYDDNMSAVFFSELGLPTADVNLGIGSGSHAQQTALIMMKIEGEFLEHRPDLVVVYGDVNSTLAAALVASKLEIPVAHVEAGLRSFDMSMPEEVNRIVTDRLSSLLFTTSPEALGHLSHDGVARESVHFVGNPMIDTLLANLTNMDPIAARAHLDLPDEYAVATLHRPSNVDSAEDMARLVESLHEVANEIAIVLPVHPRGAERMKAAGLFDHPAIHATDPLPYTQFLGLVRGSALVITDSGGIQEETTVLGIPCFTVRTSTERPVTVTHGTNRLTTPGDLPVMVAKQRVSSRTDAFTTARPPLWDGRSGERIATVIEHFLAGRSRASASVGSAPLPAADVVGRDHGRRRRRH